MLTALAMSTSAQATAKYEGLDSSSCLKRVSKMTCKEDNSNPYKNYTQVCYLKMAFVLKDQSLSIIELQKELEARYIGYGAPQDTRADAIKAVRNELQEVGEELKLRNIGKCTDFTDDSSKVINERISELSFLE
jgi:hypothetical protein